MFLTKPEINYKMMPLAPTSTALMVSKPKIGFSIDSIVGDRSAEALNNFSPNSEESVGRRSSPFSNGYGSDLRMEIQREMDQSMQGSHFSRKQSEHIIDSLRLPAVSFAGNSKKDDTVHNPYSLPSFASNRNKIQPLNASSESNIKPGAPGTTTPNLNKRGSPAPAKSSPIRSRSPSPTCGNRPILVPGIPANLVRPFPVVGPPSTLNQDIKTIPPYLNSPEMVTTHPNPHFLAAQFQMAAALAHGQAGHGYPTATGMPHPHGHPGISTRDGYPLYPWLLSRHGRIFPHRFPGNFLLQPFRKPKRVRTAFSPSQLLKLEHAFENNHYVVGSERKTLAQNLSLSETQVKVWFQNRRTKHKRMQQEGESKEGNSTSNIPSPNNNNDGSQISYDEDEELIDMEMEDECPSDEEIENQQRYHHRHQQQQQQQRQ